jgi:hypothetical protein
MLAIELTLPILFLAGILLVSFATGYLLRSKQLKSYKRKVLDLEKEMLNNHAEILELQKERAIMLQQMKESKIPVIPMKSKDDTNRQVK